MDFVLKIINFSFLKQYIGESKQNKILTQG